MISSRLDGLSVRAEAERRACHSGACLVLGLNVGVDVRAALLRNGHLLRERKRWSEDAALGARYVQAYARIGRRATD